MKLNRREFLQATGLAGLLTALGIELPETVKQVSPVPYGVSPIHPIPYRQIEASCEVIDFTGLRNMSIEVYRPIDMTYSSWDSDFPLPIYRGPARWTASILAHKRQLDAIGLFPQGLHDLMRTERSYRFAVPFREQRFEGCGILHYLRYDEGFAAGPRTVTMEIKGIGPLLDIYP